VPNSGPLHEAILEGWGSFEEFNRIFNTRTAAILGSGWGWLVYNKRREELDFVTTANHDMISEISPNLVPIINMDIWEHAYYMDYKN